MKINNINSNTLYINKYKNNEDKVNKSNINLAKKEGPDKCELSSVGKALNNLSIEEEIYGVSDKKVEEIKASISTGNYKVDTKALTEAMMKAMRGEI